MGDSVPTKTPLSVPELATRAATYGALFVVAGALLWVILHLTAAQDRRTDELRSDVASIRETLSKTREEFSEFRAETKAEFRALHAELDEIKKLIVERK